MQSASLGESSEEKTGENTRWKKLIKAIRDANRRNEKRFVRKGMGKRCVTEKSEKENLSRKA